MRTARALVFAGVCLLSGRAFSEDSACELATAVRGKTDSRFCLSCHDGSVAGSAQPENLAGRQLHSAEVSETHPVEVSYVKALAVPGKFLVPLLDLPLQVTLTDGKVTCTSCHDGRSALPAKIAMPMAGSALCMACHRV